jgi:DNA-binding response OmpR family regulator
MMGQNAPNGANIVLLVEDDPLEARMLMPLLERECGQVRRVTDAADALCTVENHEFASQLGLIIAGQSSQQLKGIGKAEFVAELCLRMPDLPVLVLGSADESPNDYAGKSVEFLPRTANPRELVSAAARLLLRNRNAVA